MDIVGESRNGTVINAEDSGRIFTVNKRITVNIRSLTLINGKASDSGGAIFNRGFVTVGGSTFINNTVRDGGTIYSYGILNVMNSTFINNTADYGGAVSCVIHDLYVTGFTFINNTASIGGAISTLACFGNIHFNYIAGNTAPNGSDIYSGYSDDPSSVNASNNWWGSNDDP